MQSFLSSAVAGLAACGAYAILGVCAVFTYRLVAVVNFTGAAIGASGTFMTAALIENGFSLGSAVIIGVLFGCLVALAIGWILTRWFGGARASVKAAVTAALLVGFIAIGLRLTGGQHPHNFPDIIPGTVFRLAGVSVTWSAVATVALAVAFTLLTEQFLKRTRTGLQLRALSERPGAAELLGVRVHALSLGVWAVTGAVSTIALLLIAPQRSPDFASLSLLVVPGLAAALIGSFDSFRAALVGGMMIGLVEALVAATDVFSQYRGTIPFFIILAVLLWSQRGAHWDEAR